MSLYLADNSLFRPHTDITKRLMVSKSSSANDEPTPESHVEMYVCVCVCPRDSRLLSVPCSPG